MKSPYAPARPCSINTFTPVSYTHLDVYKRQTAVRLNEETSTFRDFRVFDGKQAAIPLLHVKGKTKEVCVSGTFTVAGKSITITSAESKILSYTDDEGVETASIGFTSSQSTEDVYKRQIYGSFGFGLHRLERHPGL